MFKGGRKVVFRPAAFSRPPRRPGEEDCRNILAGICFLYVFFFTTPTIPETSNPCRNAEKRFRVCGPAWPGRVRSWHSGETEGQTSRGAGSDLSGNTWMHVRVRSLNNKEREGNVVRVLMLG